MYFYSFKTITERLEKACNKSNNEFVSSVEYLQACCMNENIEQRYLDKLQDFRQRDNESEERILQLEVQLNGIHQY